jgi:uncharacterized protein YciI
MPVVPAGYNVFVVDLHYVAPLERVNDALPGHMDFVKANFASGVFIASGRKLSDTGGVILAVAENLQKLEAILRNDPFQQLGLAEFRITGFAPAMLAPQLEK